MRLLETDATQFDTELLDIYLTEAGEVLDTIAASATELAANSDDRTALSVVRRGFHTLKGSGRMVGLTDLGELAYAVEKVHNRVIEEDRPTTRSQKCAFIRSPKTVARPSICASDAKRSAGRCRCAAPPRHRWPRSKASFPMAEATGGSRHRRRHRHRGRRRGRSPLFRRSTAAPISRTRLLACGDRSARARRDAVRRKRCGGFSARVAAPTLALRAVAAQEHPTPMPSQRLPMPKRNYRRRSHAVGAPCIAFCAKRRAASGHIGRRAADLQFDPAATPSQLMVRASHTLCGIHRTGGFPLVATTARRWRLPARLAERGARCRRGTAGLARAVAGLSALSARFVRANRSAPATRARRPRSSTSWKRCARTRRSVRIDDERRWRRGRRRRRAWHDDQFELAAVGEPAASSQASASRADAACGIRRAGQRRRRHPQPAAAARRPRRPTRRLLEVHDDVDRQLLPIFLDEARRTLPQAGEQLRGWRAKPGTSDRCRPCSALAHVQGQCADGRGDATGRGRAHDGKPPHRRRGDGADGRVFDALDNDLDHIAFCSIACRKAKPTQLRRGWPPRPKPARAARRRQLTAPSSRRCRCARAPLRPPRLPNRRRRRDRPRERCFACVPS